MADRTQIHPACKGLEHLIDLLLFQGRPINDDPDRDIQVLVNHGYAVGFSPSRLQPVWAAYRVAWADRDVDYDRPHLYYDDKRLDPQLRVGPHPFGWHNGIPYHVGHMVPNEVINRQFGRLAQMETFFMSNMCPQRGSLNTGVWLDLENKIRNIEDTAGKDHVWAVAGPIFSDNPDTIARSADQNVPIPDAFYCITIDPWRYPYDELGNVEIACFIIPQDAERNTPLDTFLVSIADVQSAAKLRFLQGWEVMPALAAPPGDAGPSMVRHRLLRQLR